MSLKYLDFDHSEDTDGCHTFEAMASTGPAQVDAVRAEVVAVLAWAHAQFPEGRGPLDEGFDWDVDLQGLQEVARVESLDYDPASGALAVSLGAPGVPRHTVTLALTGSDAFAEAFRTRFLLD
ncbi:MAG TPA: hypothetical protein VFW84_00330 [Aquabacterium sp.]|uniref:hypothetical protein n=1 Tax=Aquabacterium sp. TaxID=1872578 RepID=UPI002E36FCAF|nr:hypothetical protein [Aquabacterium sp.]HEX5371157.1 hypothetical protein [Aquabacterium sp.]